MNKSVCFYLFSMDLFLEKLASIICRQRWRVKLFWSLVLFIVITRVLLFTFRLWRWKNLFLAGHYSVKLSVFVFLFRDLSQSDTEQRRGDSAIVAGDRWRVHHCQLLGETPGTTPRLHIPTHWNHRLFFVSVKRLHWHICILVMAMTMPWSWNVFVLFYFFLWL